MADYAVVPYSNYSDAANLYTDGVTLWANSDNIYGGIWRITSRTNGVYMRAGIYTANSLMVVSENQTANFVITWLKTGDTTATIWGTYDTTSVTGSDWYRFAAGFSPLNSGVWTSDLTYFDNFTDCFTALTSAPIINPGVHVTFNPVYIPSFPGVHVRFNPVNTNPYAQGGDSETGGGGGQFILEDDSVPIPDLPSLNITDTHFIRAYKPDLAMLQAFQRWLWQDNPFQSWVNVLGNPYDYIVGLLAIPKTPTTGSAERPVLGNVKAPDSMPKITNQFVRHDFGTITFNEYSHSYLDYSPYTKITLYLPYIGFVPIDADYINRQTVNVQYTIDVFTGSFVAYVTVAGKVLYTYNGMMGVHVPITNQTYNNFIGGLIGIAGTIGSMIATEGATAPLGAASIASTATNILKPTVEHGNNLTGTPGVMSVQYPYFIIKRPAQSIPERMQTFTGFPSNTLKSLGDVRGFTKVEYIHIENISATEDEKAEIMSLLKEGVIF